MGAVSSATSGSCSCCCCWHCWCWCCCCSAASLPILVSTKASKGVATGCMAGRPKGDLGREPWLSSDPEPRGELIPAAARSGRSRDNCLPHRLYRRNSECCCWCCCSSRCRCSCARCVCAQPTSPESSGSWYWLCSGMPPHRAWGEWSGSFEATGGGPGEARAWPSYAPLSIISTRDRSNRLLSRLLRRLNSSKAFMPALLGGSYCGGLSPKGNASPRGPLLAKCRGGLLPYRCCCAKVSSRPVVVWFMRLPGLRHDWKSAICARLMGACASFGPYPRSWPGEWPGDEEGHFSSTVALMRALASRACAIG
mmetsp:Transcript_8843/g.22269  ORF Transcript_8843/g.22269 Transcript_8843/m.22269 type:complete len:310 (-) Transcript_8843:788-1717(-)